MLKSAHIDEGRSVQPYSRYQVMANKTIRGLDGRRFIAVGVSAFQYLFCTFNSRADYNYRTGLGVSGKGSPTGISEPTYFARFRFKDAAWRATEFQAMKDAGINFIRIGVEPAMMNASVSYVDPTDGLTYPSDPVMLDTIIAEAYAYGINVQIIPGNDYVPDALNITHLQWLANRYMNTPNVWLAVMNEPFGMSAPASINDATLWAARIRQFVLAIRATGFLGPVCIDPPGYSARVDLINTTLTTDTAFSADPNLVVDIHYYPNALTNTSFRNSSELTTVSGWWLNYINSFCMLINETAHSTTGWGARYDPNLDAGIPSANLAYWANLQAIMKDALAYFDALPEYSPMSGVSGQEWGTYMPNQTPFSFQSTTVPLTNLPRHNNNSLRTYDTGGNFVAWSAWGNIFKGYFAARRAINQAYPLT